MNTAWSNSHYLFIYSVSRFAPAPSSLVILAIRASKDRIIIKKKDGGLLSVYLILYNLVLSTGLIM